MAHKTDNSVRWFLERNTVPSLPITGWFQERIRA